MSETDLARSWGWPLGGEEASGKEGRALETELSARDLSCSDQLKRCWSLPGLPPGRYPLMADAPKLMRRTKGVAGAVLALPGGMSSSSTALSSMESELVDMLSRRMPNAAGLVGEVPDRPMVVTERRRL